MKTLLLLKRLDLAVQLCALIAAALLALNAGQYFSGFYLYFLVAGAQMLSFILHLTAGGGPWTAKGRAKYGKLLGWLIVVAAAVVSAGFIWQDIISFGLIVGFVYLICTPPVAIWYFVLCFGETQRVQQSVRRQILIVK